MNCTKNKAVLQLEKILNLIRSQVEVQQILVCFVLKPFRIDKLIDLA